MSRYIRRLMLPIIVLATLLNMNCGRNSTGSEITLKLIWQDEFEGPAGQLPDSDKWGYDIGTDWGNDQLEYDTDRPENVSLDGQGNLAITARQESYLNRDYTSARIVTRGKFETTYGKIEARIKLPVGRGIWPAFWMLGSNFETVGWPQCGEIDIMEYRGQEPQIIHGSLHGPGYSGGAAETRRYFLENDRFDNDFHVFTVEWKANVIRWYVDDIEYFTIYPSLVDGEWVFNHPFYIILNVAVGGNFVGPPDSSTEFPQTMLIDYVRVYREGN
ncbi:MAG: family 16 glycosylhydrolase [Aliifodinibius sp.]|nr:glycoside hydrolase family 16 protein [candidate division Zixibacteria bacterium]NIT55327.1 glycoside hydrolase family 16 protein [Fodinibius sp.]NIW40042.1 family 16 glycosylhydrolase [candidate division Zixibacteria bacterium]NIX54759.1 family 16 glycosylhydrolase [candidate division Zixibacteria bacterium]NIY23911.1 family 16 glycosylhydrolase [Fodinibius sp.]